MTNDKPESDAAEGKGRTLFPIKSPALRRFYARNDQCPECGGQLDTGWECAGTDKSCGYDAMSEAYPPASQEFDRREKQREAGQ